MEGCKSLRDCYLKHLGRLLQLRFLSLENTPISELPEDIGDLRFLQSLNLKNTNIKELPQSIGSLWRLKRLRADGSVSVIGPNWIGNLTSLEELHLNISWQSSIFVKELRKLTELRVLMCDLHEELDTCSKKTFVESICNLRKIQVLGICPQFDRSDSNHDTYWEGYEPPRQLRVLVILWGRFSSLPAWITSSLLPNLSYLAMRNVELEEQDWLILGSLPELRYFSGFIPSGIEFSCGAFRNLRRCAIYGPFRFFPGSMQSLESMEINLNWEDVNSTDFDLIGNLGNLPSLREVEGIIHFSHARASDVEAEAAVAAFRRAIDTHPNRPTLEIGRLGTYGRTEQEVYYFIRS
jgi:Leucine-rich repeat (LRR) protein